MTATLISDDCEECGASITADSAGWRRWCEENPEKCEYVPKGKREKGEPLRSVGTFTRLTPAQAEDEKLREMVGNGVEPDRAQKRIDDLRKYGMTYDVWRSDNGATTVHFSDRAKVTDANKTEVLNAIDEIVATERHPRWGNDITVVVEDTKGLAHTMRAGGITARGAKTMYLAPSSVKPAGQKGFEESVRSGHFMPAGADVTAPRYVVTHEYGHMLDVPSPHGVRREATTAALHSIKAGSTYGSRRQDRDPSEAFAESFAEWHLSGGKTTDPLARALARSEGWH